MLARLASTAPKACRRGPTHPMRSRSYSTVLRLENEAGPQMQVDSLIAVYKQSGKETIPEAYSRVLRDQLTLRGQLTESLAKQYGSSPYTAMRAASTSLIDQLTKLPSEVPLENPDIAKLVDSDIDTVLEVHGTSDLVRGYADAVKHVPYAGDAAEVKNVELLDDAFAMKVRTTHPHFFLSIVDLVFLPTRLTSR